MVFLWKMRERGEGGGEGGGGVGTGKGTGESMRARLSKLAFSKLPLSFSPKFLGSGLKKFSELCGLLFPTKIDKTLPELRVSN